MHSLLICMQIIIMCHCLVTQSCLTLCNPADCSLPDSSVHGISQIRLLETVAIFFSRGSSCPGIEFVSIALADRFFTTEPLGQPNYNVRLTKTRSQLFMILKYFHHSTLIFFFFTDLQFYTSFVVPGLTYRLNFYPYSHVYYPPPLLYGSSGRGFILSSYSISREQQKIEYYTKKANEYTIILGLGD